MTATSISPYLPVLLIAGAVLLTLGGYWLGERLKRRHLGTAGLIQKRLLTPNEVDFYHRLRRALGPRWTVMAQVSMGALVDTSLKRAHPRYWDARNAFAAKIVDFVVVDAQTLAPQLVVELDDVMHDFDKDARRDSLTTRAGYRTVRFWSRNKPTDDELRDILAKKLALN